MINRQDMGTDHMDLILTLHPLQGQDTAGTIHTNQYITITMTGLYPWQSSVQFWE